MTSLLDLYRGASISPTLAKQTGALQAQDQIRTATDRRRRLLTAAIASGRVKADQLGPNDSALVSGFDIPKSTLAAELEQKLHGGSAGVLGVAENLGTDVLNFGEQFVPGVIHTGAASIQDIGNLVQGQPGKLNDPGSLWRTFLKPAGQGIATDVSNIVHAPTRKSAREALYQHPLNPLLDIAGVASLGAGGAARAGAALRAAGEVGRVSEPLANAGKILQSLTDRTRGYGRSEEPRPGTRLGNDTLPRDYSARPLTKLFQYLTDKPIQSDFPGMKYLREGQDKLAERAWQRKDFADRQHHNAREIESLLAPMIPHLAGLSENESRALELAHHGINTEAQFDALEAFRKKALNNENERGLNVEDFPGVDRKYFEYNATIPPEVRALAKHPNENMLDAAEAWAADVTKGHETLDPSVKAGHEAHVHAARKFLDENSDLIGVAPLHGWDEIRVGENAKAAESAPTLGLIAAHALDAPEVGIPGISKEKAYSAVSAFDEPRHDLPDSSTTIYIHRGADGRINGALRVHHPHLRTDEHGNTVDMPNGKPEWQVDQAELAVDPEYRRQGIGTKLLHAAAEDFPTVLRGANETYTEEGAAIVNKVGREMHDGATKTGIEPNYHPAVEARGYRLHEPGRLESWSGGVENINPETGRGRPKFIRPPEARSFSLPNVTRQNLFVEGNPSFLHDSTGAAFLTGATRHDMRVLLDHAAERAKYLSNTVFNRSAVDRAAYKDENGKAIEVHSMDDIPPGIDRNKVTIVHRDMPIRWFKTEDKVVEKALKAMKTMVDKGIGPESPEAIDFLENLSEDQAKEFIKHNWHAMKTPGVIVDKSFAKYQYHFATINDPFNFAPFEWIRKFYINPWRRYTLSLMPRWAINTAVGTFLQSMVAGTFDPRHWFMGDTLRRESNLGPKVGSERFRTDVEGIKRGLPHGVRLHGTASSTAHDVLPQTGPGLLHRTLGIKFPLTAHQLAGAVQTVEDHFRTGIFVKNLSKAHQQMLAEMGETISSWMRPNMSIADRVRHAFIHPVEHFIHDKRAFIRDALDHPESVNHALVETNKFAYNYGHLGPWERRYVRQLVPFWGWYKFISKLMWRLPAEYPGRTRVMNFLSQVGLEQQNELGPIPDWLRGSIILNLHHGHLHYLAGRGLNPFASFADPAGPHGALQGLLSTGQFNPIIQSFLSASGLDPVTGQSVAISPQDNVATELFGKLVNKQGQEVSPGSVAGPWRLISGLINAFPQAQLANRFLLNPAQGVPSGMSAYPESVPFLHFRPRPTGITPAFSGPLGVAVGMTGLTPKDYDLAHQQMIIAANQAAYLRTHPRQVMKLLQKVSK